MAEKLKHFFDEKVVRAIALPAPVIALLELLKDDGERYVQRSVANNINDIGKDHPDLAVDLCRRWSFDAQDGRRWIVKHALRSLVKQSHPGARTHRCRQEAEDRHRERSPRTRSSTARR